MATLINPINPITLESQTYSSQDVTAISPEVISPVFDPSKGDYVEYTIVSPNKSFQITDQNLEGLIIANTEAGTGVTFDINLDPEKDLKNKGFTSGEYNVIYTFLRNELSSSSDTRPFFIKEISPDRTELKLGSNIISNDDLILLINNFKTQLNSSEYFQDFYLNFGSNNLIIANNILLDNTKVKYEILINLYEPLPPQFRLKDVLWIVTQTADPLAFNIQFQPEVIVPKIVSPSLKSPNFDLQVKNRTNNSTNYTNYEQLLNTNLVSSYDQILSYLAEKSISIGIDYTDFSNFVYFSSAKTRIENFYYKIQSIEKYSASLGLVDAANTAITSSTIILQEKISNIIKNFDGFEYYLYYSSGSNTYPKSTTVPPYILLASSNAIVTAWYEELIKSASLYDENNKDYLYYTIPEYLREDPQNKPYKIFVDMVGQYYDNIWVYYKDVVNRYNGDNRLEYGISKDLVADAIRSFGLKIYQNNFSTSDLFEAFTGFNSGSYTRTINPNPVDAEKITIYQTASQESLYTPLDDVNKEMYKRIYHNLPYLLKSKGTAAGLQNIISMFGITSSILSISEFGGKNSGTITGIQDINPDSIQILTDLEMSRSFAPIIVSGGLVPLTGYEYIPQYALSSQKSILQNYNVYSTLSPNVNTIEVSFSPQNDIDNYIKTQGNFDIGKYIGDPSQTFLPYYPDLYSRASTILGGAEYSSLAYIRLIKYFDNSLFNMIKDFVPARTNLKSGITIKPHLLNRSKIVQPQVYMSSSIYTGSINTAFIEGSTGGTFNDYNLLTPLLNNTQSWSEYILTPIGPTSSRHTDQAEFYNGELPIAPTKKRYSIFIVPRVRDTEVIATNGELNPNNPFKQVEALLTSQQSVYTISYYYSNSTSYDNFIQNNHPSYGNIYVWIRQKEEQIPSRIGDPPLFLTTFYLEYIKIYSTSGNSIDNTDILPILQNIIIPYNGSSTLSYISTPVQLGGYNSTYNYYGYIITPKYISDNLATTYSGFVSFFPNTNVNWDYYEYNPLINNNIDDVKSTHYMKVDNSFGITIPSNFDLIISGTADKAAVQDSNYTSKAWSNIRYNGSRQSSLDFNIPFR